MIRCVGKKTALVTALVAGSACVWSGCTQDGNGSTKTSANSAAAPAAQNEPSHAGQAAPATSNTPVRTASTTEQKPEWEEQKPLKIEDDATKRAQAENMIYATIRIKMEDMIEKRAELLKSGKAPSDVEVRQLEGSIMRARDLLQEAGEIVEDVEPPIVEVRPR